MLVQNSNVPAMWGMRLKKARAESTRTSEPFENLIKRDRALEWWS
jgi:hypothetical protein